MSFFEKETTKTENTLWVEKYRPQTLKDYIGNDLLKEKVQSYLDNNDVPHLLLYGKAGTGKTTLAKILFNELDVDKFNDSKWREIRNQEIGFIFQRFNLIDHLTVMENVVLPLILTGSDNNIARIIAKRLLKEGHEVHSLDNYDSGLVENHIEGCNYISGDIEQIEYWRGDKFDLCYHLAALSRIQPSFENPLETFRVNTTATLCVADWAKHNNVKVIYAGSSSRWHDPYQSPYACFKHMGEEIYKLYKKVYNLDVEICRFYNVYGPKEIVEGTSTLFTKAYPAAVVRFFMLQAHYRSTLDITEEALNASEKGFERLMEGLSLLEKLTPSSSSSFEVDKVLSAAEAAICDDFNAPILIASLFDAVKYIHAINEGKEHLTQEDLLWFTQAMTTFVQDVLGIEPSKKEENQRLSGVMDMVITLRQQAREQKDWTTSDMIRDGLTKAGIQMKDSKDGTTWS